VLLKYPFANVSLPSYVDIILEANVTDSAISYQAVLPDDQDITIGTAKVSEDLLQGNAISMNYPIPEDVKNLVNSLDATAVINVDYSIKGITSPISLAVSSNIFDPAILSFSNTGGATNTEYIKAENKHILLSSMDAFTFEATPSVSGDITLSNVNLREGAYVRFQFQIF